MSPATLSNVTAKQDARKQQAESNYLALVQLLLDGGDEPDADDVERILSAAGKTTGDLATAVSIRQTRKAMRDELAAAEAMLDELPALEAEANQLAAELEAARQKCELALQPIRLRKHEIQQAQYRVLNFRSRLANECPDATLKGRLSDVRRNLRDNEVQVKRVEEMKERAQSSLRHLRPRPSSEWQRVDGTEGQPDARDVADIKARIEGYDAELQSLYAKRRELTDAEATITAAMFNF